MGIVENEEIEVSTKNKGYKSKTQADCNDKVDKTKQEVHPKFIGRLATTIILEDGLYIG